MLSLYEQLTGVKPKLPEGTARIHLLAEDDEIQVEPVDNGRRCKQCERELNIEEFRTWNERKKSGQIYRRTKGICLACESENAAVARRADGSRGPRANHDRRDEVMAVLKGMKTCYEIAQEIGRDCEQTRHYLRELRRVGLVERKAVFIRDPRNRLLERSVYFKTGKRTTQEEAS